MELVKYLQEWEQEEAVQRAEASRRDLVWALQAVHIPDLYYRVYESDEGGVSREEQEAGIFQPATPEDFEEMMRELGMEPD